MAGQGPRPTCARCSTRRSAWRPSAPAASPSSTCSTSTAGARRGSAAWRRARRSRRCRARRSRLADPAYSDAARSALGIFRTPPPEGVRVPTPAGAHYLQYSFAPRLRIAQRLRAGAQRPARLRGLGQRRRGPARCSPPGEAELRAELPALRHGRVVAVLARRGGGVRPRLPRAAARLPARAVRAPDRRRERAAGQPPSTARPTAGALLRQAGSAFTADLRDAARRCARPTEAPRAGPRRGAAAGRRSRVDKVATVTLTVLRAGRRRPRRTAARSGAAATLARSRRAEAGPLDVRVRAVDLAGNAARRRPARARRAARREAQARRRIAAPVAARGRSSTRARAASARRRSPPPPRAAAPPRACARSSCPPTPRTRSPTRSRPSSGPEPDRGRRPAVGASRSRPRRRWSATGPACRTGWASCSSSAAWTASRAEELTVPPGHGRAVLPAAAQAPPRDGRLRRRRRRLRADGRDAAAAVVPRRRALVAGEGLPPAAAGSSPPRGRSPARCSTSRCPARRCFDDVQRLVAQPHRDERDPARPRARVGPPGDEPRPDGHRRGAADVHLPQPLRLPDRRGGRQPRLPRRGRRRTSAPGASASRSTVATVRDGLRPGAGAARAVLRARRSSAPAMLDRARRRAVRRTPTPAARAARQASPQELVLGDATARRCGSTCPSPSKGDISLKKIGLGARRARRRRRSGRSCSRPRSSDYPATGARLRRRARCT